MENDKDYKKANAIISALTDQRNNALNQVVALQVELSMTKEELNGVKTELEKIKKNEGNLQKPEN